MKKYFIRGTHESWGAKHWKKWNYGPILEEDELKRLGATLEFVSHRPCILEQDESPRWDIAVYSVDVPPEQNTLHLPEPIRVGSEGYDVTLRDPWDSCPADRYEKNYKVLYEQPLKETPFEGYNRECTCQEYWWAVENM